MAEGEPSSSSSRRSPRRRNRLSLDEEFAMRLRCNDIDRQVEKNLEVIGVDNVAEASRQLEECTKNADRMAEMFDPTTGVSQDVVLTDAKARSANCALFTVF